MKNFTLVMSAALMIGGTNFAFAKGVPGQHFFENWDLDGNAEVTLEELSERRGNVFLSFDADDNGILSAEEFELLDEARASHHASEGKGHGKGGGEMMELSANDTDGNGEVSREEFMAQSAAMLGALDENADGVVTSADFKKH